MLTFLLFLNDIMNVILAIMEKRNDLPSEILSQLTIQYYNRYFYYRTKIERVLLSLHKRVLNVCKTDTTHAGTTSS